MSFGFVEAYDDFANTLRAPVEQSAEVFGANCLEQLNKLDGILCGINATTMLEFSLHAHLQLLNVVADLVEHTGIRRESQIVEMEFFAAKDFFEFGARDLFVALVVGNQNAVSDDLGVGGRSVSIALLMVM